MYGGAALNAAHALIKTLDGLIAHDGTLRGRRCASGARADRRGARGLAGAAAGRRRAGRAGRAAEGRRRRRGLLPAHVRRAGDRRQRHRHRLAAPAEDGAARWRRSRTCRSGSRRGRRSEEVAPVVERLLRESAPAGADVEVELWSSSPPGLVPPDSKAIQLGLDAFERALGRRPALVRSGGTLPIVPALADKGIPTVITGLRPARLADPLTERAPRRGVRPGRDPRGTRALPRVRAALIDLHSHVLPGLDDGAGGSRRGGRDLPRRGRRRDLGARGDAARARRLPDDARADGGGARRAARTRSATRSARARRRARSRGSSTGRRESCSASRSPATRATCSSRRRTSAGRSTSATGSSGCSPTGITPVLAHPERNGEVQQRPELLEPLVASGVLVQLTAGAVDGSLGRRSRGVRRSSCSSAGSRI